MTTGINWALVTELRQRTIEVERKFLKFCVTSKAFLNDASRSTDEKVHFVMSGAIHKLVCLAQKVATLLEISKKSGIKGTKRDYFVLTKEELILRYKMGLIENKTVSFSKSLSNLPIKLPMTFILSCTWLSIQERLDVIDNQIKKKVPTPWKIF